MFIAILIFIFTCIVVRMGMGEGLVSKFTM